MKSEWRVTLLHGKTTGQQTVIAATQAEAIALATAKWPEHVVMAAASAPLDAKKKVHLASYHADLVVDGKTSSDRIEAETENDAAVLFRNRNPGKAVKRMRLKK